MKSLRLTRHWSQDQLAQLSHLNVRTIQRIEKGGGAGLETLKSLASVFEISVDELKSVIERDNQPKNVESLRSEQGKEMREQAKAKVKAIKYFYAFTAFLVTVFVLFMLPNYNGGENTGPLIVVFLSFATLVAGLAIYVFEPFGAKWEKAKVSKIVQQQNPERRLDNKH
ncbi:MAG: helix-turn-helix transcriptional regulator [Pseudomonadota bacterium]|nr:helix-turn-helix transcriptional regulator [Pseudomonadota bacterium]